MTHARDDYGYAAAATTGLRIFEATARNTGRTQRMIDRLQDGDRVLVLNLHHARYLRTRLAEAGKKVDVEIYTPEIGHGLSRTGRTYFDHPLQYNWVEQAIMRAAQNIAWMEDNISAPPESEKGPWLPVTGWAQEITR